ncbi:hypothetical protein Q1695_010555 [Nippostrongylus brasiliensis]|nr:hypothetical protein Q1695_010555 [Nippostrongylus brasiliensis]
MCDRIQQHERMMRYIQHRERVLDMQSVVKAQIARSRSLPPRRKPQKLAESKRRIDLENERLLQSLIKISTQPGRLSTSRRRSETPASRRPSRTTSDANTRS